MMVVISYDVATSSAGGQRRLRRVSRVCSDYGQRVQFSVFECIVDPAQWAVLTQRLLQTFDPTLDSLRFYFLGSNFRSKIEQHGAKEVPNLEDPLVV